jgi:serine/threonine protein kinase
MTLVPGTRLRDYEITGLIGKGGMGEVYMAEDVNLGRKVAVKLLHTQNSADPNHLKRFLNEAKVQAQLVHPNIVALHSFFEEGGAYYLVMQYAPGVTLAELVRRTGPIPEQRALRIFTQIAEALGYAHSEGVVHRDIKPSNIMIDPDKNDRVMVMDFGIARMISDEHITRTGTQLGTPCYMSPEQVMGEKDIDSRSDIYSAGVVLYEMLSGSIPYDLNTESLYKVQDRIIKEPLPDPRLIYEYISEENVTLIRTLTQKEPKDRPENILEAVLRPVKEKKAQPHKPDIMKPVASQPVVKNSVQTPIEQRHEPIDTRLKPSTSPIPGTSSNILTEKGKSKTSAAVVFALIVIATFVVVAAAHTLFAAVVFALIVIATFVVVAAAHTLFAMKDNQAYNANQMAVTSELQSYAAEVIQYYKTPVSQGGASSYTIEYTMQNMTIEMIATWIGIGSDSSNAVATENGRYWVASVMTNTKHETMIVISGIGNVERNGMLHRVDTTVELPTGNITATTTDVPAGDW